MFLGYKKGIVSKILSFFSFFIVVVLAWNLAPTFSKVFQILPHSYVPYQGTVLEEFFYTYMNQLLLFVVIVVVTSIVIFLLKPIMQLFTNVVGISFVNKTLGAFFGVIETVLVCFVLLFVLHTPLVKNGQKVIDQTILSKMDDLQTKVILVGINFSDDFDLIKKAMNQNLDAQELKDFLIKYGYNDKEVQELIEQLGY